jgi:hypothetical protein
MSSQALAQVTSHALSIFSEEFEEIHSEDLEEREKALAEIRDLLALQANAVGSERVKYDILEARYCVIERNVKDLRRRKERINFLSPDGWRIFEMEEVAKEC